MIYLRTLILLPLFSNFSQEEQVRMIRKLNKLNEEEALATASGGDEEHTSESGEVDAV